MKFNVFAFGRLLFGQINGTAIYYSYHEETVIMKHPAIAFYSNIEAVKATMDDFGPGGKRLERDAIDPTDSIPFPYLRVNITATGYISISI